MEKLKLFLIPLAVVLISIGCASEEKSSDPKSPDLFTPDSVITSTEIVYIPEIS